MSATPDPERIGAGTVDPERWAVARLLHDATVAVTANPDIRQALGLRGATALHWAYCDPERLLDEVDLVYIGPPDRDDQLLLRTTLVEETRALAEHHKWQIREDSTVGTAHTTFLPQEGPPRHLRLTVHFLESVALDARRTRPLKGPGSLRPGAGGPAPPPSVEVPGPKEIVAALVQDILLRNRPRDLYDLGLALERGSIFDGPSSRPVVLFCLGIVAKDFRAAGGLPDSPPSAAALAKDLEPLLPAAGRPLVAGRITRALTYLAALRQLAPNEAEFVDGVAAGRYRPELLFGSELPARIKDHPGAARRMWFTGKEAFRPVPPWSG